jgi:hypothetical protein
MNSDDADASVTMIQRIPKYSPEEAGRLGEAIYQRSIRAKVEPAEHGRIVAIDIESGEYAVADTALAAAERLRLRVPDAQVWCVRVGFPSLRRFRAVAGGDVIIERVP